MRAFHGAPRGNASNTTLCVSQLVTYPGSPKKLAVQPQKRLHRLELPVF